MALNGGSGEDTALRMTSNAVRNREKQIKPIRLPFLKKQGNGEILSIALITFSRLLNALIDLRGLAPVDADEALRVFAALLQQRDGKARCVRRDDQSL